MARTKHFEKLTKEQRVELARKGGLTISKNKEHMREIGRKGGLASGAIKRKKLEEKNMSTYGGLTAADINLRG